MNSLHYITNLKQCYITKCNFRGLLQYVKNIDIEVVIKNNFLYGLNPCIREELCSVMLDALHEIVIKGIYVELLDRAKDINITKPPRSLVPSFSWRFPQSEFHEGIFLYSTFG